MDIIFGTFLWLILIAAVGVRLSPRLVPGTATSCSNCSYDLIGHDANSLCPECGTPRGDARVARTVVEWDPERYAAVRFAVLLGTGSVALAALLRGPIVQWSINVQVGPGHAIATAWHTSGMDIRPAFWAAVWLPLWALLPRPWYAIGIVSTVLLGAILYTAQEVWPYWTPAPW